MKVLIPAIIILGLAFIGLAIRVILIKGGKFSKRCSSVDPISNEMKNCECNAASKEDPATCKFYAEHHPEEK